MVSLFYKYEGLQMQSIVNQDFYSLVVCLADDGESMTNLLLVYGPLCFVNTKHTGSYTSNKLLMLSTSSARQNLLPGYMNIP